MFFKKKSKIKQPQSPQKPATIQERMTEVYTRMSQKNTQSLAGYMNGSNSLY